MSRTDGAGALKVEVGGCGPEAAGEVHRLTQLAFGGYGWLTPPSGALRENTAAVRQELEEHGGALARLDGRAVGALRLVSEPAHLHVRRVAIDPAVQRSGIGTALMDWARDEARRRGYGEIRVGVRAQLPGNRAFYERLGYRVVGEHPHPGAPDAVWFEMRLEVAPTE
jgi:tRNA threonylcarbamoyladenosine biosynthesis protein TsaE